MFWIADYRGFEVVEGEEIGELFRCWVLGLLVSFKSEIYIGEIPQRHMSRSLDLPSLSCEEASDQFLLS